MRGPIQAELISATRCKAEGIEATGTTPVLNLCRQLLAAGLDPDRAVEVYRRAALALRVRSIAQGAKLTVTEDAIGGPRFRAWKPIPLREGVPDFASEASEGKSVRERAAA